MNPEVKAKWVEALRSGNYKQGQSALKYGNISPEFCCLGVLCDLAEQEGLVESSSGGRYTKYASATDSEDFSLTTTPRIVAAWLGVNYEDDFFGRVMTMNDHGGKSFSDIADYIESIGDTYESE